MGRVLSMEKIYELFEEYKITHNGNCSIPQSYKTSDGINLGIIARNIRAGTRTVTYEQVIKLNEIGFVWEPRRGRPRKNIFKE